MKDRLLKFLNREQLSSARFAEIIGVQPSGISHIISGRNKPGFDFIQKILINYPSLNAEWLITGKGNMFKNENIQRNLFSGEDPENDDLNIKEIDDKADRPDKNKFSNIINDTDNSDTNVTAEKERQEYKSESESSGKVTSVNKGRFIEKIVILYSDKSFNEYFPE